MALANNGSGIGLRFSRTWRCLYNKVPCPRSVKLILGVTLALAVILYTLHPTEINTQDMTQQALGVLDRLRGAPVKVAPCKRELKFSTVPLPVTALASVQGSGNTWMRHILQQLTGIYTGSKYRSAADPELLEQGYLGEGVYNGSVIAVKTHGLPEKRYRFRRVILVIRNPFDAMFADFNRRATASHTGLASASSYIHHWKNFSMSYAERWAKFNLAWLSLRKPLLLLNFDDLVHSLASQVKRIAAFLNHPSIHFDIDCVFQDSRGRSKRQKTIFSKEEVFSPEEVEITNTYIRVMQKILQKKYPKVSQAIGAWQQGENWTTPVWKAVLERIT